MTRLLTIAVLLLGGLGGALAADTAPLAPRVTVHPEMWRYDRQPELLPFSRTARSQSVYASGACWTECQSYCTWGEAACLKVDAQGRCLQATNKCDRYCQRECRTRGGPLLSFEMPWD